MIPYINDSGPIIYNQNHNFLIALHYVPNLRTLSYFVILLKRWITATIKEIEILINCLILRRVVTDSI